MQPNNDYQTNFSNSESSQNEQVLSSSNLNNLTSNIMPNNSTLTDSNVDQTPAKTTKKQPLIVQAVQNRKGLYPRVKSALIKQISKNIDDGNNANIKIEKFIFDLIEMGLKSMEK